MSDDKSASFEVLKNIFQELEEFTAKRDKLMSDLKQFLLHHIEDSNFPELMGFATTHMLKFAKSGEALNEIKEKFLKKL